MWTKFQMAISKNVPRANFLSGPEMGISTLVEDIEKVMWTKFQMAIGEF